MTSYIPNCAFSWRGKAPHCTHDNDLLAEPGNPSSDSLCLVRGNKKKKSHRLVLLCGECLRDPMELV